MPAILEPLFEKARERHKTRQANPGVAIEVEKVTVFGYRLASPHSDTEAWQAMVCDALGTRSDATAETFLFHLAELCSQHWHPSDDGGGEWCPDERELNMILNFVAGIKPKNEMEAALAAQMVAVHLMTMRVSARALSGAAVTAQDAAIAGKLARTFAMQIDTMSRLKGTRSSSKQTITVRQEKHVHHHQHVHIKGGGSETGDQPLASGSPIEGAGSVEQRPPLPRADARGAVVPLRRDERKASLPDARGK